MVSKRTKSDIIEAGRLLKYVIKRNAAGAVKWRENPHWSGMSTTTTGIDTSQTTATTNIAADGFNIFKWGQIRARVRNLEYTTTYTTHIPETTTVTYTTTVGVHLDASVYAYLKTANDTVTAAKGFSGTTNETTTWAPAPNTVAGMLHRPATLTLKMYLQATYPGSPTTGTMGVYFETSTMTTGAGTTVALTAPFDAAIATLFI